MDFAEVVLRWYTGKKVFAIRDRRILEISNDQFLYLNLTTKSGKCMFRYRRTDNDMSYGVNVSSAEDLFATKKEAKSELIRRIQEEE